MSARVCGMCFFNDTATTEIYTLSLHDALPISYARRKSVPALAGLLGPALLARLALSRLLPGLLAIGHVEAEESRLLGRSEEHTSELQSRQYLVCRLLLEKEKKNPEGNLSTRVE